MDKLNMNHCSKDGQEPPGLHEEVLLSHQEMQSFSPSPLLGTGEPIAGLLCALLDSPVPKRHHILVHVC